MTREKTNEMSVRVGYLPARQFEIENSLERGTVSRRYHLPKGYSEATLEAHVLAAKSDVDAIFGELMRLNPEVRPLLEKRVSDIQNYKLDVIRGMCSEFNVDDIVFYISGEYQLDIHTSNRKMVQFEKKYDVKVDWILSPETESRLSNILSERKAETLYGKVTAIISRIGLFSTFLSMREEEAEQFYQRKQRR